MIIFIGLLMLFHLDKLIEYYIYELLPESFLDFMTKF
jgi:hypothetical protein